MGPDSWFDGGRRENHDSERTKRLSGWPLTTHCSTSEAARRRLLARACTRGCCPHDWAFGARLVSAGREDGIFKNKTNFWTRCIFPTVQGLVSLPRGLADSSRNFMKPDIIGTRPSLACRPQREDLGSQRLVELTIPLCLNHSLELRDQRPESQWAQSNVLPR